MSLIVYGATGYTGRLVARLAADYGLRPILAGRSAEAVAGLARELGLEHRVFPLDDAARLRGGLAGCRLVLHCAGPFARTWRAMSDACLATGVHYLDVTGEIEVFQGLADRDGEARQAGVLLLPGVGFDVVPTDCLAAYVAGRLPSARRLLLGIASSGPLSHGTATTALENQHRGGMVRRDGRLTGVPAGWRTRELDFGDGRVRTAVTIPWGDVATAWHSTGIPDIEVYAALPPGLIRMIRASRHLGWLLRRGPVKALQQKFIDARPAGPDAEELARGTSRAWARVEDDAGRSVTAALKCPNAYLLTAHTALMAASRVLEEEVPPGFQTPSTAFGADFILGAPRTVRFDLDQQEIAR
jgi:short subunit dehydrogenase-like uncharacterized protein